MTQKGRLDAAKKAFKTGSKLDPKDEKFYKQIGKIYAQQCQFKKAIENYKKAININPTLSEIKVELDSIMENEKIKNSHSKDFGSKSNHFIFSKSFHERQCILHIGTEKTGTTAIQNFLYLNKSKLLDQGFLFPTSLGEKNNRYLSFLAYDETHFDSTTQLLKVFTSDSLKIKKSIFMDDIRKELLANNSKAEKVIFSSEFLQSRLVKSSEIYRLKNILSHLNLSVEKIILYIRNPIELAVSLVSTYVKSGGLYCKIPPPNSSHYFQNICNHKATIERWSEKFGSDKIIVRLYDPKHFYQNSLLQDFFCAAGIRYHNNFDQPSKVYNKSLDLFGITLLSLINKDIPMFNNDKCLNPIRGNLAGLIEKHCSNGMRLIPNLDIIEVYNEAFKDSNEWVRQKFFPNKKQLFTDPIYPNIEEELPPIGTIADLISDIWISKQQQIVDLRQQIAVLKKQQSQDRA